MVCRMKPLMNSSLGIKVLITDHHQAGSSVPNATVVVNPNQPDGGDSLRALAGVGVAFYVICAFGHYGDRESLGTIARWVA